MAEDGFKVQIKIPEAARDLVVDIGMRLRDDPAFLGRLRHFFEEDGRESIVGLLREMTERMQRFEMRIDQLSDDIVDVSEGKYLGPDPAWTKGDGLGKKLTDAGVEEMRRLITRGMTDKEIGIRMGISRDSVVRRRRMIAMEDFCKSGVA